jgi:hypothetical protein
MRRTGHALAASVALLALAGVPHRPARADPSRPAAPGAAGSPRSVSAEELEATYGVRLTQVAVTGGGGLVDLRFTIVDPARARPLFHDHGALPRLVAEGSGLALDAPSHGAMHNVRMQKNAACFLLYPNTRGAIQPGTKVAVAFDGIKVGPLTAK